MKFKILSLIFMLSTNFAAKANEFNYSISYYAKITAIDVALNKVKSFEEINAVALKMYAIVCKNFNDTCLPPKTSDYKEICAHVATRAKAPLNEIQYYEYYYEKKIDEMACVNIGVDNEETVRKKLQSFWNKYKTSCKCDALSFGLPNGNFLKYALSQNMPEVIETLASTYGLDINFIDPADGLNLLDYIIGEIERLKKLQNSKYAVKVYEDYKASVIGLGGKSNKK